MPLDCLLIKVEAGLPFSRATWHGVVGELLVLGCADIPLAHPAPRTYARLLAPEQCHADELPRERFSPIQQVHFGARDLRFGAAFYRPEHAGYNDEADVIRLLQYLDAIDPAMWDEEMLRPMPELLTAEDRAEELAFARGHWSELVEMYRDAADRSCVVVCETV